MRRVLLYLLLFVVVGSAGYLLLAGIGPGYVLIYAGGYTFETTVTALVLALAALVLLFNVLLWLVRTLNPLRLRNTRLYRAMFGQHDAKLASLQGLQDLLLGNWQQAYRALVEAADRVENPCGNYLAAALAAFQRGDRAGWMFCLDRAEQAAGSNAHGVRSLRALLEARSGGTQQALTLLQGLQRAVPNQPFVLQQLLEHYREADDWDALATLLPELEKRQVLTAEPLRQLQVQVFQRQLQQAGSAGMQALQRQWKQVPKTLRSAAPLTGTYIQQLLLTGQEAEAASVLTAFIKKDWSTELIGMVGEFNGGRPQQQLALLENCLVRHPDDAVLLLTLGRVAVRNQLWRKARDYFDKTLHSTQDAQLLAQANTELARLLEHLGEREKSFQHYQRAIKLLES